MKLLKHKKKFWSDYTTHLPFVCKGEPCVVHNPSDHHMRKWPLNYRLDIGITERICRHGVNHPDPDCSRIGQHGHGCDGCCVNLKRVAKVKRIKMENPPAEKLPARGEQTYECERAKITSTNKTRQ